MQVTGYQRAVDLKPLQTPEVKASKDLTAYGGNQFGTGMMADAMGKALDVSMKIAEEKMVTDVTAATNEYNKRLSDLNVKLQENKLGNADGLTNRFEEEERKIRADVLKMVPSYKRAQTAFNMSANRDSQSYYRNMANYQADQLEKNKDFVVANSVDESIKRSVLNLSPESVGAGLQDIQRTIAATYGNRGAEFVTAATNKSKARLVADAVSSASGTGNNQLARTLLDTYKNELTPEQFTELGKTLYAKEKIDTNLSLTQKAMAAGITSRAGFIEWAKKNGSIGNFNGETYNMPVQSGIDYDNVSPELKYAMPAVGGMLGELGKIASISSGYRDPERNRNAGGAEGSYHLKGNAVDIAFERNLTPAEVEQVKQKFGAHFEEVLFHDAGSGNHLHLGGYKGTIGNVSKNRSLNDAEIEEAADRFEQQLSADKRDEARAKSDFSDNLMSAAHQIWMSDPNNIAAYDELLKNNVSNPKYFDTAMHIVNTFKKLSGKNREKSDINALVSLDKADLSNSLTPEMVQGAMDGGTLSGTDYVKYMKSANKIVQERFDDANKSIDKEWSLNVDKDISNKKDAEILTSTIRSRLDREGYTGQERFQKAMEWLKDSKEREYTTNFNINNTKEYGSVVGAFGVKAVRAVESGYMTKSGVDYWQVNQFLSSIGRMVEDGDEAAKMAVNAILQQEGMPLNSQTFQQFYARSIEILNRR